VLSEHKPKLAPLIKNKAVLQTGLVGRRERCSGKASNLLRHCV